MTRTRMLSVVAAIMAAALMPSPALAAKESSVAAAQRDGAIIAAIESAALEAIAAGGGPGLQVAVFKDGKPLLVKGFGSADLELDVPVDNASVFRIGSITKQFTAAVLFKLQEEGKLSLGDALSKYYPDFPHAGEITLRQMLNHTSGLYNYTELPGFFSGPERMLNHTTDEMVAFLAKMPTTQDFAPGTSWHYSNTAYFMLGGVIEKVEKKPIDVVFKERIFAPLGMEHSAIDNEAEIVPGRVSGYDVASPGEFQNASFISMTVPGAAGSMRSTASDLIVWTQALFGGKLLKPASFAAMTSPGKLNDGRDSKVAFPSELSGQEAYGMGLITSKLDGHRRIGHMGGINGFSASVAAFPQDHVIVAVLANGIGKEIGVGPLAERIQKIALGLSLDK